MVKRVDITQYINTDWAIGFTDAVKEVGACGDCEFGFMNASKNILCCRPDSSAYGITNHSLWYCADYERKYS